MTKQNKTEISEYEAIEKYAAYLHDLSWCVDISSKPMQLLHGKSNHVADKDTIKIMWRSWLQSSSYIIKDFKPSFFMRDLHIHVMSHLVQTFGTSFRPTNEQFIKNKYGATYCNTYSVEVPPRPNSIELPDFIHDFFATLMPVEAERKQVLMWLGATISQPLVRPVWGVMLYGDSRTGKSLLFKLLKVALQGRHFENGFDFTESIEKFSEDLPNNLFVEYADKVAAKDTETKLKQWMSENERPVKIKNGQKTVQREIYTRLAITSNREVPLKVDSHTRRWLVVQRCTRKFPLAEDDDKNMAYYRKVSDWIQDSANRPTIYHWLNEMSLDGYDPQHCLETPTLLAMIESSTPMVEQSVMDFVEDKQPFIYAKLESYLKGRHPNDKFPEDLMRVYIERAGFKRSRIVVVEGEPKEYVWMPLKSGKLRAENLSQEQRIKLAKDLENVPYFS